MPYVIGLCGASNSGKTTLARGVVEALCKKGLKVGAIKHHGHPEPLPRPDPPKDSDRLAMAGARRTAFCHAGGLHLELDRGDLRPADIAAQFMSGMDVVVVEGYKKAKIDKIEVVAPDKDPILPSYGRLLALTRRNGGGKEAGLPVLDANQPRQVADFIIEAMTVQETRPPRVSIKVDGEALDLHPYVVKLVADGVGAMIRTFRGAEEAGRIEVTID